MAPVGVFHLSEMEYGIAGQGPCPTIHASGLALIQGVFCPCEMDRNRVDAVMQNKCFEVRNIKIEAEIKILPYWSPLEWI